MKVFARVIAALLSALSSSATRGRLYKPSLSLALFLAGRGLASSEEDAWLNYITQGKQYQDQGRYSEAENSFLNAYRVADRGRSDRRLIGTMNNLANLYRAQGKYLQAERMALRVLEVCQQVLGAESGSSAVAMNNLAEVYRAEEKASAAEPLYLRAIATYEKLPRDEIAMGRKSSLERCRQCAG